ncbi:MAG: citrate lyase subunit alpha [Candidatus Bipolaricaulota bacterium]|nr:MAG: citrate lyase subunit alpha [Candidatus Bipolaricaulota bacterium]
MKNAVGREIPEVVGGRTLRPFEGAFATRASGRKAARAQKGIGRDEEKLLPSLDAALEATGLADGMTISFHHCFRDGDALVNQVVDACARKGLRDLRLFATALFPVHKPLLEHIESGVIGRIEGSMNGPVGAFVSQGGMLRDPAVLRSHGGRWRAVEAGDVHIDVAFIAAPQADAYGNANGIHGKTPCGPITFASVDAQYADQTVVVTNDLAPYPAHPFEIQQGWTDYVVEVDEIGDPGNIASGTLQITRSPTRLRIARLAADVVVASPYFVDGFSFQGGAGGVSLATVAYLGEEMERAGIVSSFAIGGGTRFLIDLLHRGRVRTILEGQAFDIEAIRSLREDDGHVTIDPGHYANYDSRGSSTYRLDAAFLGATEVDLEFNANVNTHSDGLLLHGIGGHQDVAAGASMTIITVPALRGRLPVIVDRVTTVTTPGEVIDVIVTDRGIAVNPAREELRDRLVAAGLPVRELEEIKKEAEALTQPAGVPVFGDEIIAVIEWRDGTVIDVVRKVEGWA